VETQLATTWLRPMHADDQLPCRRAACGNPQEVLWATLPIEHRCPACECRTSLQKMIIGNCRCRLGKTRDTDEKSFVEEDACGSESVYVPGSSTATTPVRSY
jgi:hypothetical protein